MKWKDWNAQYMYCITQISKSTYFKRYKYWQYHFFPEQKVPIYGNIKAKQIYVSWFVHALYKPSSVAMAKKAEGILNKSYEHRDKEHFIYNITVRLALYWYTLAKYIQV